MGYNQILATIGHPHSWEVFHLSATNRGDGDKELAKRYLEKYWLTDASYQNEWKNTHHSIFDLNKRLPDMIFKKDFKFITLLGGVMFEEKDFEQFRSCIQKLGERNFVIVQDTINMEQHKLNCAFKMKYPVDIEWNELMNGNFISTSLFERDENNYYIFGESGLWGIYIANDYFDKSSREAGHPIRIISFTPEFESIFREAFEIPEDEYCENLDYIPKEERPNLKEWVPRVYRK